MLHYIARYRLYCVISGILIALLLTICMVLPAVAVSLTGPQPDTVQHNNQLFHGTNHTDNHIVFVGQNQGNTGNTGINRGYNQDDADNGGNQVSGQRKPIKTQVNNQSISQGDGGGGNGSGNSATFVGALQGNSGNLGINTGNYQNNPGNLGNQVNNQGNVIGTQINKQGTSVNNSGNIIYHQINYVNLIPGLGFYFSARPKLLFGMSFGN